jgi:hypothetical protein
MNGSLTTKPKSLSANEEKRGPTPARHNRLEKPDAAGPTREGPRAEPGAVAAAAPGPIAARRVHM